MDKGQLGERYEVAEAQEIEGEKQNTDVVKRVYV